MSAADCLQALTAALQDEHLPFVLDLASLAARREYLNLEKWLTVNLKAKGEPFFKASGVVKLGRRAI